MAGLRKHITYGGNKVGLKNKDCDKLIRAINKEWIRLYGGSEVFQVEPLILRVSKIAEDRDCWLRSHKTLQKAYNKLDQEKCNDS